MHTPSLVDVGWRVASPNTKCSRRTEELPSNRAILLGAQNSGRCATQDYSRVAHRPLGAYYALRCLRREASTSAPPNNSVAPSAAPTSGSVPPVVASPRA
ncbi:hypothetical protein EDF60_1532 [Leucobacter luti]|nr:hypothetical protein EDF60_1532 [Leucobacter luti]